MIDFLFYYVNLVVLQRPLRTKDASAWVGKNSPLTKRQIFHTVEPNGKKELKLYTVISKRGKANIVSSGENMKKKYFTLISRE